MQEATYIYYDVAHVKAVATPHGLTAIIDLPLKAPDQDMVAYEIVSRPVLEQGTKRPVKAKSEGDFLLVNEDA